MFRLKSDITIEEYKAFLATKTPKEIEEDRKERIRADQRQRERDYWREYDRKRRNSSGGCTIM